MKHDWLYLLAFLSLEGAVVGWGVWQVWSLRRERKLSKRDKQPTDPLS